MAEQDKEIYKTIPSCTNYESSNFGNVRSIDFTVIRSDGKPYTNKSKILKQSNCKGYLRVFIGGKLRYVHQLVAESFLNHISNGHKIVVDHVNEDKTDNRLCKLQLLTNRANLAKSKKLLNSASKYTGVFYRNNRNKWFSQIRIDGVQVYLGSYKNEYDAHLAYQNKLITI